MINRLLRQEANEYWVVDENKRYLGVVRQQDLLSPPRIKVVLVDHNEPQQSIANLEESELLEILDHHRLGNQSTHNPIKFTVDIVGSTSTLVTEQITEVGLSAPPRIAGLLLAGLLSDTLIFSSPTTTPGIKLLPRCWQDGLLCPARPWRMKPLKVMEKKSLRLALVS